MKNVNELYKKYYNAYKSDYDADDELKEDKKKKVDYKQFELGNEINKESKLGEKMKELELTELDLIQIKSNQVLAMKKFLVIWIDW